MKDFGFIFVFFGILLMLMFLPKNNDGGLFSGMATSTATSSKSSLFGGELSYTNPSGTTQSVNPPPQNPKLTNQETERRIADITRNLDSLKEDVRKAKLREPTSPFAGIVTLSSGNTYTTDPNQEYLEIRIRSDAKDSVSLDGWYLKSYVTDEANAIPDGDRLLKKWRSPSKHPIVLLPGENAYLISGKSPIDTSFHENKCTGYLSNEEKFSPSLYSQCPRPLDEMKQYGKIKLDNDNCYDFVERLYSCTTPSDEDVAKAKIGSTCTYFIDHYLDYDSCVVNHAHDPLFDDTGHWYIYLGNSIEQWRPKREIIRLFDSADRVVDVLEY